MSDPQPDHLGKKPPRADPVQPDLPGSGNAAERTSKETPEHASEETERAKEQAETAIKNNRDI